MRRDSAVPRGFAAARPLSEQPRGWRQVGPQFARLGRQAKVAPQMCRQFVGVDGRRPPSPTLAGQQCEKHGAQDRQCPMPGDKCVDFAANGRRIRNRDHKISQGSDAKGSCLKKGPRRAPEHAKCAQPGWSGLWMFDESVPLVRGAERYAARRMPADRRPHAFIPKAKRCAFGVVIMHSFSVGLMCAFLLAGHAEKWREVSGRWRMFVSLWPTGIRWPLSQVRCLFLIRPMGDTAQCAVWQATRP